MTRLVRLRAPWDAAVRLVPVIAALAYAAVALVSEGRWFASSVPGSGTG